MSFLNGAILWNLLWIVPLILVLALSATACSGKKSSEDPTKKSEGVMTYAEYDAAAEAFCQARIEETVRTLDAQGIKYEDSNDDEMLMYVTAEQFTDLTLEWASLFGLARA